jgi:hypothetical protein
VPLGILNDAVPLTVRLVAPVDPIVIVVAAPKALTVVAVVLNTVAVVDDDAIVSIPVNDIAAEALFNAIDVVPTNRVLLPNTPVGIVPDKLPAVNEVNDAPEPLKPVAVNTPVDGLNVNFVVEIFAALLPAAVVHKG